MTLKVRILQFGGSNNFDQKCSKKISKPFLWSVEYYLASVWKFFIKFHWHGQNTRAVHKLRRQGGGGQKSPILRRHSLWTAPMYLQKLSGQTRNLGKTKSCEATKNKRDAWVMYIISNSNEKKSVFESMDFWRVSKAKPLEFWWCHAEHYSLRAWLFVPNALVHN